MNVCDLKKRRKSHAVLSIFGLNALERTCWRTVMLFVYHFPLTAAAAAGCIVVRSAARSLLQKVTFSW